MLWQAGACSTPSSSGDDVPPRIGACMRHRLRDNPSVPIAPIPLSNPVGPRRRRPLVSWLLVWLLPLLSAGCGEFALLVVTALPGEVWETQAQMEPLREGRARGLIRATAKTQGYTVSIEATGLQPRAAYTLAFLRGGTCQPAEAPQALQAVDAPLITDAQGTISTTIELKGALGDHNFLAAITPVAADALDPRQWESCGVSRYVKLRDGVLPRFSL